MQVGGAVTGRMARWLLLACTVIGVAAMHTLGHAGSHTGAHHAPADGPQAAPGAPSAAAVVVAFVARVDAAAGGCAGDGCAHAQPRPEPGRHDLPAWSVCLAVLAGFGAAVLLAWLLLTRTTRVGQAARRWAGRHGECRAPPWPGVGLQLASVSVMRT